MRFVAIDFETSGLDPKRNAPVTLGACVFQDGEPIGGAEWLIAPPRDKNGNITKEYDVTALEISKTSWKAIKNDGEPAAKVLHELARMIGNNADPLDTVVAFNAPFDFAFYSELVFMAGGWNQSERRFEQFVSPLVGPWQCVRYLAIHTLGESKLPKWNLDTVAGHFGLSRDGDSHGALEDAILAGKIYSRLTGASDQKSLNGDISGAGKQAGVPVTPESAKAKAGAGGA